MPGFTVEEAPFARAGRGHWGVENQVHRGLDVRMNEEQSRARAGHPAGNLATLRRLVLNLRGATRVARAD